MNKDVSKIVTSKGVMLGERVYVNGHYYMRSNSGKKYDVVSPQQVVELITGCKVKQIVYENKADIAG